MMQIVPDKHVYQSAKNVAARMTDEMTEIVIHGHDSSPMFHGTDQVGCVTLVLFFEEVAKLCPKIGRGESASSVREAVEKVVAVWVKPCEPACTWPSENDEMIALFTAAFDPLPASASINLGVAVPAITRWLWRQPEASAAYQCAMNPGGQVQFCRELIARVKKPEALPPHVSRQFSWLARCMIHSTLRALLAAIEPMSTFDPVDVSVAQQTGYGMTQACRLYSECKREEQQRQNPRNEEWVVKTSLSELKRYMGILANVSRSLNALRYAYCAHNDCVDVLFVCLIRSYVISLALSLQICSCSDAECYPAIRSRPRSGKSTSNPCCSAMRTSESAISASTFRKRKRSVKCSMNIVRISQRNHSLMFNLKQHATCSHRGVEL